MRKCCTKLNSAAKKLSFSVLALFLFNVVKAQFTPATPNDNPISSPAALTINGIYVGKGAGNAAYNTAVGEATLSVTGNVSHDNTAIGYSALKFSNVTVTANSPGSFNTAVGSNSLLSNTSGKNNTAVGAFSLQNHLVGYNNTAIGANALIALNSTADNSANNTAVGQEALYHLTSGVNNTAIGVRAGAGLSGVSMACTSNVAIGAGTLMNINGLSANGSYQLNIQNCIYGVGMGQNGYGTGNVGIGVVPSGVLAKLEVGGKLKINVADVWTGSLPVVNPGGNSNKYLYLDQNGIVGQAPVLVNGVNSCGIVGNVPRVTNLQGNMGCGIINDNGSQVGIGAAPSAPGVTFKLQVHGRLKIEDVPIVTLVGHTGNYLSVQNGVVVQAPLPGNVPNPAVSNAYNAGTGELTTTVGTTTGDPVTIANLYLADGAINSATTTNNIRTVTMNQQNIWFKSENGAANGKIYIGDNFAPDATNTLQFPGIYKLCVEDGIISEKVKVAVRNSGNWADYVFADNYTLMPIKELALYVKANKHLPGINAAEDLVKNGLDLGKMQASQMAKIEELTLYIIDQSNKLEKQNAEIEALKAQVKILLEKIK